jgi:sodium-dependent dicarboxylate transporter 2/3/5
MVSQEKAENEGLSATATLTAAEERFEKWRKNLTLFLGPLLASVIFLLPMPTLNVKAHTLAAVCVWVITWWIGEPVPLPVTSLLGAVLCILGGVAPAKTVLAPFADPIVFLFLGSFLLAEAMMQHRLDRRFAYAILAIPWIGEKPARILFAFGFICAAISMWISNTATTAMMLPIGLGIIAVMNDATGNAPGIKNHRFATGIMLMAAYAASTGGIGTPVGTPPNLIGIAMIERLVKVKISFFRWMIFAVPLLACMYLLLFGLLYLLHRPEQKRIDGFHDHARRQRQSLGPWSRGQKNALAAFMVAVILWVTPGFLAVAYGTTSPAAGLFNAHVPEAGAALIAALLLFLLPVDWKKREFTLSWKQAVRIDWGTLLLFGGGLTLGELMFQTKLAEAVGSSLLSLSGATSVWGITLAAIFIAILLSEATSNTAAANMVVPVIISLALAAKVNPLPPAIGATLGASWGFMLPVSTPPNAIVYGSGLVRITQMLRAGLLFDILGGFLLWFGLRLLLPIAGLG